jgi:hypothetical protein
MNSRKVRVACRRAENRSGEIRKGESRSHDSPTDASAVYPSDPPVEAGGTDSPPENTRFIA